MDLVLARPVFPEHCLIEMSVGEPTCWWWWLGRGWVDYPGKGAGEMFLDECARESVRRIVVVKASFWEFFRT